LLPSEGSFTDDLALGVWHQRLWRISEAEAVTCPVEQVDVSTIYSFG
jgi:hypothetical protein